MTNCRATPRKPPNAPAFVPLDPAIAQTALELERCDVLVTKMVPSMASTFTAPPWALGNSGELITAGPEHGEPMWKSQKNAPSAVPRADTVSVPLKMIPDSSVLKAYIRSLFVEQLVGVVNVRLYAYTSGSEVESI